MVCKPMVAAKKKPQDATAMYPWPLKLDQGDVKRYLKLRKKMRARIRASRMRAGSETLR